MARKPRVHYYGAVYHVIARGNNKQDIFFSNRDKQKYLHLIADYKDKFDFSLYAYALMNNHVHMLIEVKEEPLSKIMQGIQLSYTLYINNKYQRVGHVFQQRYKALLCLRDEHLLNILRYIHRNPVKAGLDPKNYRWSSHYSYLKQDSLVDSTWPLSLFHNDRRTAIARYLEFIQIPGDEELSDTNYKLPDSEDKLLKPDSSLHNQAKSLLSPEELLDIVCRVSAVSKPDILSETRKPAVVKARHIFIYLCINSKVLTRAEVAKFLSRSPSTITKVYNQVHSNSDLYNKAMTIEKELAELFT